MTKQKLISNILATLQDEEPLSQAMVLTWFLCGRMKMMPDKQTLTLLYETIRKGF